LSKFKILSLVTCLLSLVTGTLHADTLTMKDGRELKGIVIEDFKDRVIFSTADGEVTVMKENIQELSFESEEDNLIKLAEQAKDRGDFARAYSCYEMASKVNPDSKSIKEGMIALRTQMFRKNEAKKEEAVMRRDELERYGPMVREENSEEAELAERTENLKNELGITLTIKEGMPQVDAIAIDSPAYEAGIRKGDLIVAVRGKLTGYMSLKDVMKMLLEKQSIESRCVIERTVIVPISENRNMLTGTMDLIGASFSMEFDGLTISDIREGGYSAGAGLKKGDSVVAIYGQLTRYMPLKKALDMIKDSKANGVNLTVRRELSIWRR